MVAGGAVASFVIEGLSSGCVVNPVPGTVILGVTRSGHAAPSGIVTRTVRKPEPLHRGSRYRPVKPGASRDDVSRLQSAPKSNDADSDASSTASASCSRSAE